MSVRRLKLYMQVEVPSEVRADLFKQHAAEAVKNWGGSFHPEDPLFPDRITVLDCKVTVDVTRRYNEHPSKRAPRDA